MQAHTHTHTLRHTLRRTHTLFRIKMKEKQRFQSQMFQSSPTDEISGLSLSLSQSWFMLTLLMLESLCSYSSFISVAFQ